MIEGPLLTWKGRRVRSAADTPESAGGKVPAAPRPGSLFFVPSPLEGWGIDVLLERLSSDSAVVVFEKDAELAARCAGGWKDFLGDKAADPRLFLLELDTEEAVQALFRRLPLGKLRRCEFLTLNGAWLANGSRCREVFSRLEDGLTRWWSNRVTCMQMGPLWIKNLFDNLRAPEFQIRAWPDWEQDTVLVCGAGVTLESALPWAREQRRKLRILAVDTALPVLKAAGLTPDAVVCLEAQHANLRDFAGWKGADIELFADLTCFPPGSRVFRRTPFWFLTEFADLSLWGRWPWEQRAIPRLPPLGSVGVAAAWVAWRLTKGQVILAGLDFSYPQGKTHARGAPALAALAARTRRWEPMEQPGTWVRPGVQPTRQGWLTTPVMAGYAGVLADQARGHAERTSVWSQSGITGDLPVWAPQDLPRVEVRSLPLGGTLEGSENAQNWLRLEEELWRTILETFEKLNGRPDPAAWQQLETLLTMTDYLTFSFPDPEFRRDSDWLIRAQVQVRWILGRLRPRRS